MVYFFSPDCEKQLHNTTSPYSARLALPNHGGGWWEDRDADVENAQRVHAKLKLQFLLHTFALPFPNCQIICCHALGLQMWARISKTWEGGSVAAFSLSSLHAGV